MGKLVIAVNAILLALLFTGLFAPVFYPEFFPLLQILPVLQPVFASGIMLCTLFWYRKSGRRVFFNIICLSLLVFPLSRNARINVFDKKSTENDLKVITYNVNHFGKSPAKARKIADFLAQHEADVICLQEFGLSPGWEVNDTLIPYFAKILNMPNYHFARHKDNIMGLMVFSKYPIQKTDSIYLPVSVTNGTVAHEIQHPNGKFCVINFHLFSYNFNRIAESKTGYITRWGKFEKLIDSTLNMQIIQAGRIREYLSKRDRPCIVTGDMNATPNSYIYSLIADDLQDSFLEEGSGVGFTYTDDIIRLRLDYQFATTGLKITEHAVKKVPYSDHYPVVVTYAVQF